MFKKSVQGEFSGIEPGIVPDNYDVKKVTIKLDEIRGASKSDLNFLAACSVMLDAAINTKQFYSMVCDPKIKLDHDKGLTKEQIFNKIVSGATELEPDEDNEMNIRIVIYYSGWSRVIGYTLPNSPWQWFNRKFMWGSPSSYRTVCANMLHEYCHRCGFEHESRGYSQFNIPYFYGNCVENVIKQAMESGKV